MAFVAIKTNLVTLTDAALLNMSVPTMVKSVILGVVTEPSVVETGSVIALILTTIVLRLPSQVTLMIAIQMLISVKMVMCGAWKEKDHGSVFNCSYPSLALLHRLS